MCLCACVLLWLVCCEGGTTVLSLISLISWLVDVLPSDGLGELGVKSENACVCVCLPVLCVPPVCWLHWLLCMGGSDSCVVMHLL